MNNQSMKDSIDQELCFIQPDLKGGWEEIRNKARKKNVRDMYRMRPPMVAAILLAIILIPVSSVAAYEVFQRTYHLPQGEQTIRDEEIIITDNVVTVEQNREENVLLENIELVWTGSYVKGALGVLTFQVRTIDGTPLIKDGPNKAPILYPLTFEEITICGNGSTKTFAGYVPAYEEIPDDYYIACTGIAEDLSSAEFELKLQNGIFDIQNNNITVQLKNMLGIYHEFEDLNTVGTLGEILSGQEERKELHVAFSEEYPECYIDSYKFISGKGYGYIEPYLTMPTGEKMFTMTVVCDDASKDTIRQMVFQNTNTGLCANVQMPAKELADGRLQFFYSVNYDGSYVNETYNTRGGEKRDTTMEDMQYLVLKLGGKRVIEPVLEGTLEEVITVK